MWHNIESGKPLNLSVPPVAAAKHAFCLRFEIDLGAITVTVTPTTSIAPILLYDFSSLARTCSSAVAFNNHNTIKNLVVEFYGTDKEWTRHLSDLRRLVSLVQKKGTMFYGRYHEEEEKWGFLEKKGKVFYEDERR